MSYAFWTNLELRRLETLHANGRPTESVLAAALPKHPPGSILHMARKLGLRSKRKTYNGPGPLRRLKLAHEYYARREQGSLE